MDSIWSVWNPDRSRTMTPIQPAPFRAACEQMGQGASIANDEGGRAGRIEAIAFDAGHADFHTVRDLPAGEGGSVAKNGRNERASVIDSLRRRLDRSFSQSGGPLP